MAKIGTRGMDSIRRRTDHLRHPCFGILLFLAIDSAKDRVAGDSSPDEEHETIHPTDSVSAGRHPVYGHLDRISLPHRHGTMVSGGTSFRNGKVKKGAAHKTKS